MKQKITAVLLVACLVIGCMQMAFAEAQARSTVQLVEENPTGGIEGWSEKEEYDYIYYGNWANEGQQTASPLKWRVLDTQTNTGEDGLFLLSEKVLGAKKYGGAVSFQVAYSPYHSSSNPRPAGFDRYVKTTNKALDANAWQGSYAQRWCMDFAGINPAPGKYYKEYMTVPAAFTDKELGAIMKTTKDDEYYVADVGLSFAKVDNILNEDQVFFLSVEEAEKEAYGLGTRSERSASGAGRGEWWLRSPSIFSVGENDQITTRFAGMVRGYKEEEQPPGNIDINDVDYVCGARPAFNLDLASVLMVTDAEDSSKAGGRMTPIQATDTSEWKLTLKDEKRDQFSVGVASVTAAAGENAQLPYAGVPAGADGKIGKNEYVSVLLSDQSDRLLYYGQFPISSAAGVVNMPVPQSLPLGVYNLRVFSEQSNGAMKTDYASGFENLELVVVQSAKLPQTGDGSMPVLWAAFALASATAAGFIWKGRRSRTN